MPGFALLRLRAAPSFLERASPVRVMRRDIGRTLGATSGHDRRNRPGIVGAGRRKDGWLTRRWRELDSNLRSLSNLKSSARGMLRLSALCRLISAREPPWFSHSSSAAPRTTPPSRVNKLSVPLEIMLVEGSIRRARTDWPIPLFHSGNAGYLFSTRSTNQPTGAKPASASGHLRAPSTKAVIALK